MSDSRGVVEQALDTVPSEAKAQAYQAWLGYYNSSRGALKWSQADLIQHANAYALDSLRFGPEPPGMLAKTVGKMGLRGVPGLKVVKELPGKSGGGWRGGGSGDTGRGQGKRLREGDGSGSMLMEERGHGVNGDGNMMGGGGVRRGGNRGRASFGGGIAR